MSAFKDMLHEQYTNGGELKQDQGGISIHNTTYHLDFASTLCYLLTIHATRF